MKRTADFAPQPSVFFRRSSNSSSDGNLRASLAVSIPGAGQLPSLFDVLLSLSTANRSPLDAAAVDLIFQLDLKDDPPAADDAVCQWAAQLLLAYGQAALLRRLAEVKPMHYLLDVGANDDRLNVLEDIGLAWPQQAGVTIKLSTGFLSIEGAQTYEALQPFFSRPAQLSVSLSPGEFQNPSELYALAQLLKSRPLDKLSLEGRDFGTGSITALVGVSARGVVLSQFHPGGQGMDPIRPLQDAWTLPLQEACVALVKASGAAILDVSGKSMPVALTLRLLACRRRWECATLNHHPQIMHALHWSNLCQIDHMVLLPEKTVNLWRPTSLEFGQLQVAGVRTLVYMGNLDLNNVLHAMEAHAKQLSPAVCPTRIRACFVLPSTANKDRLVALHRYNRRCDELLHDPSLAQGSIEGFGVIDPDMAGRLHAINGFDRSTLEAERTKATKESRDEAAHAISKLLDPSKSSSRVFAYIKAPPQWVVPAHLPVSDGETRGQTMTCKLNVFKASGLDVDLMRAAIKARLRRSPKLNPDMYKALRESEWDIRNADAHVLQELGKRYAHTWVAENNGEIPEWQSDEIPSSEPVVQLPQVPIAQLVIGDTASLELALTRVLQQQDVRNNYVKLTACKLVLRFVQSGLFLGIQVTPSVAFGIADLLQRLGQPKLFRHLVPGASRWPMRSDTPNGLAFIQALGTWPDSASQCELVMLPSQGKEAVEAIKKFALDMKPEQVVLHISVAMLKNPEAHEGFWKALTDLVKARPGLSLTFDKSRHYLPSQHDWDTLTRFLDDIGGTPVREMTLMGLTNPPETVADALVKAVKRSKAQDLVSQDLEPLLEARLLAAHSWRSVVVAPSDAMTAVFRSGAVGAGTLRLNLAQGCNWNNINAIVGTCKGIKAVEFKCAVVDFLPLAQALDGNSSVTTVTCAIWNGSDAERQLALALLRKNRSLVRFTWDGSIKLKNGAPPVLNDMARKQLQRWVAGNRLLRPDRVMSRAFTEVVMTQKPGSLLNVDVMQHICSFLDVKAAVNLSSTNRAAYKYSRQEFQREIDKLSALLATQVDAKRFAEEIQERFPENVLAHRFVEPGSVRNKVTYMRGADFPDPLVKLLLGRRLASLFAVSSQQKRALNEPEQVELWTLLEALNDLGAIPLDEWLREGMDVLAERKKRR